MLVLTSHGRAPPALAPAPLSPLPPQNADETGVGYGVTQAIIDVVPGGSGAADLAPLRAALSRALHLANLCPNQPSTPLPPGAPAAAFARFCEAAGGGGGRVAHFATMCISGAPEDAGPYVQGRAAGAVTLD